MPGKNCTLFPVHVATLLAKAHNKYDPIHFVCVNDTFIPLWLRWFNYCDLLEIAETKYDLLIQYGKDTTCTDFLTNVYYIFQYWSCVTYSTYRKFQLSIGGT